MEMSKNNSNYIPELHVAQQRRRDKLRVQHFDDLQHHNFQHIPSVTTTICDASTMIIPSQMLHFPTPQSISGSYPNIHPTHFVPPSRSDSCEPHHQQNLHQSCENWVPSYDHDHDHHQVVDHDGRPRLLSAFPPHFLPPQNNHNCENDELPLFRPYGLSLSLSSNRVCEYQQQMGSEPDPRGLNPIESGSISSVVKQSISSSNNENNANINSSSNNNNEVPEIIGGSIQMYRNVGPLGPFTGYASILKSSKFLKPAQLLLDEVFAVAGIWRGGEESENGPSVENSRSIVMAEGSSAMVPKMHGSNDLSGGNLSCESYKPDCHERKAKLLHMQEEVCKRHKQYHQQMQMVISAFDSVPGLANATPYISRSIKTISRHFRCLKNAIADQLKHIRRALGEDLSSPTNFLKGDSSTTLGYDPNFMKSRSGSIGGSGHVGHQNHVWRPQRGLPERAVSILRAWLFDHFLHPYPTDNDKQMLASQTGLTRNQVSNWFINARVRLWKPMVEEIHMLETKPPSHSEPNSNANVISVISKNQQAQPENHSGFKPPMNPGPCHNNKHLESFGPSTSLERPRGETNTEQLFQKCSRVETHHVPTNIDSSFVGFLPYQRRGVELGGLGAVSLTLGLRHGSETNQQLQHQFLPQGMPFGGHVIHDFTG